LKKTISIRADHSNKIKGIMKKENGQGQEEYGPTKKRQTLIFWKFCFCFILLREKRIKSKIRTK
jgi:hypothetical protein